MNWTLFDQNKLGNDCNAKITSGLCIVGVCQRFLPYHYLMCSSCLKRIEIKFVPFGIASRKITNQLIIKLDYPLRGNGHWQDLSNKTTGTNRLNCLSTVFSELQKNRKRDNIIYCCVLKKNNTLLT